MTTSPITSVTDELLAELERLAVASKAAADEWISYDDLSFALANKCDINLIIRASPTTILALLAERAELKRDADRLEWIVDQVAMVHTYPGRDGASYCVYWPDSESEQAHTHATPREAIDAAMQEAKP